ncbi:MAG: hypothetical protein AUI14_24215 [Actinobacteria bacterium 13_2_20CM_2_71_6]|nr:MAG: hypothetical protein AUI14_24215 [Actinobacteria bacterium 13_2_20CM_2_71_6]
MTVTPAPGPAPRRRSTGKRLLVVLAVVLVVCCGGAVAAAWALFKWYDSAAGPAQAATETFLTDLEKDNTSGAYALLCTDVRGHLNQQGFADLVAAQKRLRSHKIVGTSVSTVNGKASALITTDLTREGGVQERRTVPLVKEGSSWLVCGSPY